LRTPRLTVGSFSAAISGPFTDPIYTQKTGSKAPYKALRVRAITLTEVCGERQESERRRKAGRPSPSGECRFKTNLYRQLDELLPPDVIIASSSSGVTVSEIQSGCASYP
jgi:hypothetical protein